MQAPSKGTRTAAERSPLLGEEEVEECLEDGLSEVHDFQSLLAARPKKVIKWLQEDGIQKLGEFDVQVRMPSSLQGGRHSITTAPRTSWCQGAVS